MFPYMYQQQKYDTLNIHYNFINRDVKMIGILQDFRRGNGSPKQCSGTYTYAIYLL